MEVEDGRAGNNKRYEVSDAVLSAFSVFFLQNPSFLSSQVEVQRKRGRNNAETIFGVHQIPSDNQIRNILDGIAPETFEPVFDETLAELEKQGSLKGYRNKDGQVYVAVDGTGYFSSDSIHCDKCSEAKISPEKICYTHMALTPVIVHPEQEQVISLMPEFVEPQDGHEKQDCELAAAKRWIKKRGELLRTLKAVLLADDLYSCQPFLELVLNEKLHFIVVCKPGSHKTLYEYLEGVCLPEITTSTKRIRAKSPEVTTYRFMNDVPLRDGDDALSLSWCEMVVKKEEKVIYRNSFVTDFEITKENVAQIATAGRARWKIENENNNVLKNNGYHLEHNFGHGKVHLSQTLFTLNIMAFLFHTVLGFQDEAYQKLCGILPRNMFFNHVAALTFYLVHESWDSLVEFMWVGLHKKHVLPQSGAG